MRRQLEPKQWMLAWCDIIFERTLDVEAPADQAPIQFGTLSPVASHDLFCFFILSTCGRLGSPKQGKIQSVKKPSKLR
jgi:hypothetical protein